MSRGYTINLEALCATQTFSPSQVTDAELVFPKGAVPNSLLLWARLTMDNGEKRFVTLPLTQFYEFIDLPLSNLGGLVEE